jgi:hypothetical protein
LLIIIFADTDHDQKRYKTITKIGRINSFIGILYCVSVSICPATSAKQELYVELESEGMTFGRINLGSIFLLQIENGFCNLFCIVPLVATTGYHDNGNSPFPDNLKCIFISASHPKTNVG